MTVLADGIGLTAGMAVTRAVSSSAPAARTFGFRATHVLDGRTRESTEWIGIEWRPTVILAASPASVAEDGGATQVTVTATLTGTSITKAAKTVTVSVAGGTATAGDDFEPVDGFKIEIAGETRGAEGSFTLTPVTDSAREGPETVAIAGTATDGSAITVVGTEVGIVDADPKLTVTAPTKGYVTGTTGSGDAETTVIDCGSGNRTDCSATLAAGAVVTLTATADAKHLFTGWTGACGGTADCTITLNADGTVGASFVAARNLIVTAPTHGRVTGRLGTKTVIDCGSDCSETVADGATVALRASADSDHRFDGWGGACAAETAADCSVTLDADRTVSVVFVSTAVVGKCDGTAVDACAAGTPNTTAVSDTDSHHRWRCDGSGGGANSGICTKAKLGCRSGERSWSAGGHACAGSIASASSGQTKTALDAGDPTHGSAAYKCNDGVWLEQPGGTCSVNLQCGTTENACLPDGVQTTNTLDTPKKDGACAGTEAAQCLDGTTFRDLDDIPLKHGECGATTNRCDGGTLLDLPDTATKNLWRCEGIDAEDRWACLGVAGSANWSCSYGAQTKACDVPIPADDDYTCGVNVFTQEANDSEDCFTCTSTSCGDNETRNTETCDCECESGYHRHKGACVVDASCPEPTVVENACEPAAATLNDLPDTVVRGKCEATEAAECAAGEFVNQPDTDPVHGVCGEQANTCDPGMAMTKPGTTGTYIWDCLGIPGQRKWRCTGTDGDLRWQCTHGAHTSDVCKLVAKGSDADCGVNPVDPIPANNDLNCTACMPDYEEYDGNCVKKCGSNEVRNADGICVCKAGHKKFGGVCEPAIKVTVDPPPKLTSLSTAVPKPVVCNVTAPDGADGGNGISCGHLGNDCEEYYEKKPNGTVKLTITAKSGYEHDRWTRDCRGTSTICTLTRDSDKNVSANCEATLEVNPGGPYTAKYTHVPLPPPLPSSGFYSVRVEASASGGVPAYEFQWSGQTAGASTVYLFTTPISIKNKDVVVTDREKNTAEAEAKISRASTDALQGASEEPVAFEVPLGGDLHFIWGGDGDVTARSEKRTVVTVDVSSPGSGYRVLAPARRMSWSARRRATTSTCRWWCGDANAPRAGPGPCPAWSGTVAFDTGDRRLRVRATGGAWRAAARGGFPVHDGRQHPGRRGRRGRRPDLARRATARQGGPWGARRPAGGGGVGTAGQAAAEPLSRCRVSRDAGA